MVQRQHGKGELPESHSLQWHPSCHILHPRNGFQSENGRRRKEAHISYIVDDHIWIRTSIIGGEVTLSSGVLIISHRFSSRTRG